MPYPIAKLAYGLRCRLSDLSTPAERYHLQIAAGNVSICPTKRQLFQGKIGNIHFRYENGTILAYRAYARGWHADPTPLNMVDNSFYNNAGQHIVLHNIEADGWKSKIFYHFVHNARFLLVNNCHVSKLFYETVKTWFPTTMVVDLNTNVAMNFINFTDLLTALPKIQQITSMRYHNANWITEILQVKHHLLTVLTLRYEHFEQCDEFDKNQLLTFLKAQRTGFRLTLDIREANVEFVAQLMEFLDKNLDRDYDPDKADYYFRNEVAITNGTETIGRWCLPPDENEMHFLVKSKPLVKFSLAKTNEEAEYEVVDGEII